MVLAARDRSAAECLIKTNEVTNMKTIDVEIRGNTPLLIHKFAEQSEQAKATRRVMVDSTNPRDEATKNAYVAQDGTYYFNAFSIPATMANAGVNHKMRGSRKTLKFVVPSAVRMESDTVTILADDGKLFYTAWCGVVRPGLVG